MHFKSLLLATTLAFNHVLSARVAGLDAETLNPDRYIVVLKRAISIQSARSHYNKIKSSHQLRRLKRQNEALEGPTTSIMTFGNGTSMYVVQTDGDTLDEILKSLEVDFVQTDILHRIPTPVNATKPNGELLERDVLNNADWHLHTISYPKLASPYKFRYWDHWGGYDSVVYVLDTGINLDHEEFENRGICGRHFGVPGPACGRDVFGHGTAVASLAVGKKLGVAKRARVIPVRILDSSGSGSGADIIEAINWVIDDAKKYGRGRCVMNLSLGGEPDLALDLAINAAYDAGVLPVVAAGNEDTNVSQVSPARASKALAVGALDKSNARSEFSNFGAGVRIWAPGEELRVATPNCKNCYEISQGTSFASPIVAGLAAYFQSSYDSPASGQTPSVIQQRIFAESLPGVSNYPIEKGLCGWNRRAYNGGA